MRTSTSCELLFRRGNHTRWLEAELLLQLLEGAEAPNVFMPITWPLEPTSLLSKRGALFDGDPRLHRSGQYALAVVRGLILEQFPRGHADDSTSDALLAQRVVSGDTKRDFAAGGDQQDLGVATRRFGKNVGVLSPDAGPYFVRSNVGSGWRSTSATGSWRSPSVTRHASATSLASHGRIVIRPGIARSDRICSTGWWVGPSSPTPIESCVNT